MPIVMYKGQDSEIVEAKQVPQHLDDGWTFTPSNTAKGRKDKIKADAAVNNKQDLDGPKDLTTKEK